MTVALIVKQQRAIAREPADETQARRWLGSFAATRDSAAMEAFYIFYQARMFHLARRLLRNAEDAEDVVHAAFIELMRRAGEYAKVISLHGWVLSFVRKACLMKVREELRRVRREAKAGRRILSGQTVKTPPSVAENQEIIAAAMKVVRALPAKYREPVLFCYYHGFSTKEAAQMIGKPEGTVRSLLFRAAAQIRTTLKTGGFVASGAVFQAGVK
jgi:RNA polymerase sigma-70 factor (ECF subfamily)